MTASHSRPIVGSEYTLGEEIANSITSGIASGLSVAALVVMVVHAARRGDGWCVAACAIFGASLILSNLSSTLYHAIALPRAKRVFRVFDHLSIYFLIAGTYMPFVLVSLRGAWGWTLCGIVWGLAALGLAIKLTPLDRVRGLSTGAFLAITIEAIDRLTYPRTCSRSSVTTSSTSPAPTAIRA